jgi:hypothetical protein
MTVDVRRFLAVATFMALAAVAVLACARTGGPVVVARVDGTPITRATLSHWMAVIVAGDNLEHVGRRAPGGLVSDPPDQRACRSAIESMGQPKEQGRASREEKRLAMQCHELHAGVAQQTLSFLIHGMWSAKESAQLGIVVGDREVQQRLEKVKAEHYPTNAAFEKFLSDSGLTLSDERLLIRQSLQMERLEVWHRHSLSGKVSGGEALERALIEGDAQRLQMWSKRTRCSPGYDVQECTGFKALNRSVTPPALLLEQIAAARRLRR